MRGRKVFDPEEFVHQLRGGSELAAPTTRLLLERIIDQESRDQTEQQAAVLATQAMHLYLE